jgi:putative metallohydrolase (TIGR04338 family)
MPHPAATLASKRTAHVAARADREVLRDQQFGSRHSERVDFDDFRTFAKSVWAAEGRTEPLYVSRVEDLPAAVQEREFEGAAAAARWEIPAADRMGMPRTGELADTTGPVAYIDVKDEGLNQLFALHELGHLLVDSMDSALGHGPEWAQTYSQLIERHLGPELSALWRAQFQWWSEKAAEKIANDPNWLA